MRVSGLTIVSYEQAKAEQSARYQAHDQAMAAYSALVDQYPRGPMNLVPAHVKAMPAYPPLNNAANLAFERLRAFNQWFNNSFPQEIQAERIAKHMQQADSNISGQYDDFVRHGKQAGATNGKASKQIKPFHVGGLCFSAIRPMPDSATWLLRNDENGKIYSRVSASSAATLIKKVTSVFTLLCKSDDALFQQRFGQNAAAQHGQMEAVAPTHNGDQPQMCDDSGFGM